MQRAGPGAWTSRIACGIGGRPPHSSHLPVSEVMGESLSNKTGVSGATQTDQLGNNKKPASPVSSGVLHRRSLLVVWPSEQEARSL